MHKGVASTYGLISVVIIHPVPITNKKSLCTICIFNSLKRPEKAFYHIKNSLEMRYFSTKSGRFLCVKSTE